MSYRTLIFSLIVAKIYQTQQENRGGERKNTEFHPICRMRKAERLREIFNNKLKSLFSKLHEVEVSQLFSEAINCRKTCH